LCGRLDYREQTFPGLRCKIRLLLPDLSRGGVHHRAGPVDVSDLAVAVTGRQIERHHPARASEDARRRASRARAGRATRLIDEYVKVPIATVKRRSSLCFLTFLTNQCCKR